jgi:hypothetical protein
MYTLQGKSRLTRHTHPTLSSGMVPDHTYLTRSTHSSLSQNRQQICTDPLPLRRRAPNTIHSSTTVRSVGLYSASLPQQQWGGGEKTSLCWQSATRLTGPITPACDRYVQYLLTRANSSVLNRHRRSNNLEGAGFPHTTLQPSLLTVSPLHLQASPGLYFNHNLTTKPEFEFKGTYGHHMVF